jgi:hypothetical protein
MNKYEMLHKFLKKKIGHDCSRLILADVWDYDSKKPQYLTCKGLNYAIHNNFEDAQFKNIFTRRNRTVFLFLNDFLPYKYFIDNLAMFDHNDFVWNKEDYIYTRGIDRPFLKNQHWGGKNGKYEKKKYYGCVDEPDYHYYIRLPTDIYFKDNHYYFINEKTDI